MQNSYKHATVNMTNDIRTFCFYRSRETIHICDVVKMIQLLYSYVHVYIATSVDLIYCITEL